MLDQRHRLIVDRVFYVVQLGHANSEAFRAKERNWVQSARGAACRAATDGGTKAGTSGLARCCGGRGRTALGGTKAGGSARPATDCAGSATAGGSGSDPRAG